MKKTIFIPFFILCLTGLQAQRFTSISDSLREQGIKRIVSIQVDEVDSIHFFKPREKDTTNFTEWLAAHNYKEDGTFPRTYTGSIRDIFAHMLDCPPAYIKVKGVVPKVFLRCRVGFRKVECKNDYLLNVTNFLERYYNFRLEKVQDSLDVFVIHKEYPEKLSIDERQNKPPFWADSDGRIIRQQFISQLDGQDIATLTSRMSYSYREIFVLADEDKLDDNSYYILEESKDNKSIDSAYKEMKDNGLCLTKEKKIIEFYRLTFF